MPQVATPTYSATKAAMHAYTLALRYQLEGTGLRVVEIVPPKVQTGLQGAGGFDPEAMALDDYVAEVFDLLAADTDRDELAVERARGFRHAEREGRFDATFRALNDARAAEHGNPPVS